MGRGARRENERKKRGRGKREKKPRKVTKEDIEAFEKQYPAYGKIGKVMLEAGIWCLVESREEKTDEKGGSQKRFRTDR